MTMTHIIAVSVLVVLGIAMRLLYAAATRKKTYLRAIDRLKSQAGTLQDLRIVSWFIFQGDSALKEEVFALVCRGAQNSRSLPWEEDCAAMESLKAKICRNNGIRLQAFDALRELNVEPLTFLALDSIARRETGPVFAASNFNHYEEEMKRYRAQEATSHNFTIYIQRTNAFLLVLLMIAYDMNLSNPQQELLFDNQMLAISKVFEELQALVAGRMRIFPCDPTPKIEQLQQMPLADRLIQIPDRCEKCGEHISGYDWETSMCCRHCGSLFPRV